MYRLYHRPKGKEAVRHKHVWPYLDANDIAHKHHAARNAPRGKQFKLLCGQALTFVQANHGTTSEKKR